MRDMGRVQVANAMSGTEDDHLSICQHTGSTIGGIIKRDHAGDLPVHNRAMWRDR